MRYSKHAFEWGYGYGAIALCLGFACAPLLPKAYAGNYMSATMLVTMGQSEDMSRRAMAAGYIAAIHDELAGIDADDPACFAVPQSIDMQEMAERTIHFVDWFAHELKGWPKDTNKDFKYPARELVHLGLVQHFPCESI